MAALVSVLWEDPSELAVPPPPFPENPLQLLDDDVLELTHSTLIIGCGKSKLILKEKRRRFLCLLAYVLEVEKKRRQSHAL